MSDNQQNDSSKNTDSAQMEKPAGQPVEIPPELAIPIPEIPKEEEFSLAQTRNRPGKKERERLRAEQEKQRLSEFTQHEEKKRLHPKDLFENSPLPETKEIRPLRDTRPIGRLPKPAYVPPTEEARPSAQSARSRLEELFRSPAEPQAEQDPTPIAAQIRPIEATPLPESLPSPSGRVLKAAFPFMKPSIPTPQPKRRGRPPRNPLLITEPEIPSVPKKRGRPPRNPALNMESKLPKIPKKRGRPPKKASPDAENSEGAPPFNNLPLPGASATNSPLVPIQEIMPSTLVVLPIGQRPIMPGITIPLVFSDDTFLAAIKEIWESEHKTLAVSWSSKINSENVFASELCSVGTAMRIVKVMVNDGSVQILARAIQRLEKQEEISRTPLLVWRVSYLSDSTHTPGEELKAYTLSIISTVKDLLKLSPLFQEQLKMLLNHLDFEKPGLLMDLIAAMTTAQPARLQKVLEARDLLERGKLVLQLLKEELDVMQLQHQIKSQIDEKISKHQKDFFLKEQLKIIKKELGLEKDEKTADLESFRARLEKSQMPAEARKVAEEEISKLSILESASSEYPVTRTYLGWLCDLPWGIITEDQQDLVRAKQILDASHHGLDDVKDRVLEFIATMRKRKLPMGSIICLVGAPGVGKTSVARSIADSLGRKFYRFSVGGMRDEAEIKGHRRTYVGAMPGKIIQSLKRAGSSNPVILLDEIDKLHSGFQGDPAAALLEVLDSEQNKEFLDHYLDVRIDLSGVLFITTANSLDTIPAPLLDRMEVIKVSGYILEEKVAIARDHLLPHQLKEHGLQSRDLKINDKMFGYLVENYAREAGVRNLEKTLQRLCRKIVRKHAEGNTTPITLSSDSVTEFLGQPIFAGEELYNNGVPGTALGLAWTSMGGATLYVEALAIASEKGGFEQTGQMGAVMEESARIAYSFARSSVEKIEGSAKSFFQQNKIHLHIPAGATPKDGPSAGITMALAMHSLATNKPVRAPLAMTGELTITGKVLPVGGIREKIIAAKRVKVFEVILPAENRRDFEKLPEYIRSKITVHYVGRFSDLLAVAYNKSETSFGITGKGKRGRPPKVKKTLDYTNKPSKKNK